MLAPPVFDQRPGDLDPGTIVCGQLVCSHKTAEGWRVLIQMNGAVTGDDARRIAAEINRYADLIDERVDW